MSSHDGVAVQGWERGADGLAKVVWEQTDVCLKVYAEDPSRVLQDANNERRISEGGYATRQLEELLQNAVDAARKGGERVEVLLTKDTLYVANDGEPFDERGLRSVMASDISSKDDDKIGKFGIGFKSVLAVSTSPRVFSRTVSFGFDKAWATETLKDEGYEFEQYPTMRLARSLDPISEGSARDDNLRELMEWASTVVVVPLAVSYETISRRLYDFPAEFILFSAHIKRARLRNLAESDPAAKRGASGRPADRSISQEAVTDGSVILKSGGVSARWVVKRALHVPSSSARREGGHVASRQQVEVQYALPIPPGSNRLGRFWAYFPTNFETTLTGLINAPWKLSDDRTGLLEGGFNIELLERLPGLVGQALQILSGTNDAVSALDAMPARGLESRNWVDREINDPIFRELRRVPSLPDGTNTLRRPADVKWIGDAPTEWLEHWARIKDAPLEHWLHPSAYSSPERRNKIVRLMQHERGSSDAPTHSGIDEWLEALVSAGTVEASAEAILLAARVAMDAAASTEVRVRNAAADVRSAKIIRLENGEFRAPAKGRVFVRVPGDTSSDVDFVDPALAALPAVREALSQLGIVVMDRSGELRRLLAEAKTPAALKSPDNVWSAIWAVLRDIPRDTALQILREDLGQDLLSHVRVRTAAGTWLPIPQVFLPGRIIPADGSRDRDRLIDPRFHARDEDLLHELDAVDAPVWRMHAPTEAWFAVYEDDMRNAFIAKQPKGGSRPDPAKIQVSAGTKGSPPPWPLAPLRTLSAEGIAAATEHLMSRPVSAWWRVQHTSNASYGTFSVIPPEVWFLRKHGLLRTEYGVRRPTSTLLAGEGIDPSILPAVDVSDAWANALGIERDPETLSAADWRDLKAIADTWRGPEDDERRTTFYAWLPGRIECDSLVVRVGRQLQSVETKNIGVTSEVAVHESMVEAQIPVLFVADADDAERFVETWGMPRGKDLLQEEIVAETSGEAVFLTDMYPPLKLRLDPADQDLRLQPASRLVKMIATPRGQVASPIQARRDGDVILVTATKPTEQIAQVSRVLGLGMDAAAIAKVLQQMERTATNKLRTEIKKAKSDDERLVVAVGVDALRRCVPAQALEVLDGATGGASPTDVASLARSVHGVAILKQLRPALEERGLEPPREWTGRHRTRQWVHDHGFPADWAGFPGSSRAAVEVIDGPAILSPLHDYQDFVTDRIKSMLRGVGNERGMVSLPTGAGKTRVTVQALVNAVREGDVPASVPQIWIAQTDELCEQAAETWTYVWRAIGPQVPMRLGRLWANNEVPEEPGTFQLVIATVDKLNSLVTRSNGEYDWLRQPSVVVIDEAHTSIASSYTRVLDWLGRGARPRKGEVRKPLIGLTATPFRGTSVDETERLAGRYLGNRLDRGAFTKEDPYEELQDMRVLAQVKHRILDGSDAELTASDIAEIEKMKRLPPAVAERLGANLTRTLKVVDSIAALPDDWTILAFAPSVENARVLAALLSHQGIPAVSVSADTETAARRHYVEEFKAGRIRVLTNFNVLTQGFDAPKVQAVYVARPTFSPNVYQQMIGRGLRGPKNGGSEEVLIVNVQDNFQQYGDLLAFREFEYLWTKR
ncbi:DEAD/DEAH box helicase [Nocardioides pelophilus]|uniref:DEAD/DEAH box helicase n=1 Tax=Nocardioides pelophilus TaxID=2172019 RepID=UPI001603B480|nr:DEAD/DEAH box helicase family protein [Nocardioides pelophilus]